MNLDGQIAGAILLPSAAPANFATCVLDCLESMSVNTTGSPSIQSMEFNVSTRTLTLLGSAPDTQYEEVLHTVEYLNKARYPNIDNITLTIDDGTHVSSQVYDVIVQETGRRRRRDAMSTLRSRRRLLSIQDDHQEPSGYEESFLSNGPMTWLLLYGLIGCILVIAMAVYHFVNVRWQAIARNGMP